MESGAAACKDRATVMVLTSKLNDCATGVRAIYQLSVRILVQDPAPAVARDRPSSAMSLAVPTVPSLSAPSPPLSDPRDSWRQPAKRSRVPNGTVARRSRAIADTSALSNETRAVGGDTSWPSTSIPTRARPTSLADALRMHAGRYTSRMLDPRTESATYRLGCGVRHGEAWASTSEDRRNCWRVKEWARSAIEGKETMMGRGAASHGGSRA